MDSVAAELPSDAWVPQANGPTPLAGGDVASPQGEARSYPPLLTAGREEEAVSSHAR